MARHIGSSHNFLDSMREIDVEENDRMSALWDLKGIAVDDTYPWNISYGTRREFQEILPLDVYVVYHPSQDLSQPRTRAQPPTS